MVRNPSVDKNGIKKGAWSDEEDNILRAYIETYGHSNWSQLPKFADLARCGKSCRLRWLNYLKPGLKKGIYSKEEEDLIIKLREELGNKWSIIASKLPGRTDNEIKNHWHTHLKKRGKQADPKPCESREKTTEEIHLPDQDKNPSIIITESKKDQECMNDIDDNAFLELCDILENEPFSLDELNTMISPSAGSYNSTISFTEPSGSFFNDPFSFDATNSLIEPSGSFLNEPFTFDATNSLISTSVGSCNSSISFTGNFLNEPFSFDATNSPISPFASTLSFIEPSGSFLNEPVSFHATNSLISPSDGSCNSTISFTKPTGSFLNEPFSLDVVTNSLISPSSSCNSTIPIAVAAIEASNNHVFHTNREESINAGSGWTEPSWLSTFYQVLSSSSSSSKNEGLEPFSASDGYDLFNYSL